MKNQPSVRRFVALIFSIACILPLPLFLLFRSDTASKSTEDPIISPTSTNSTVQTAILASDQSEGGATVLPGPSDDGSAEILPITASSSFSIEIPSIDLDMSVVPNVDPADRNEYLSVIETSVAHGDHTALPTDPDGNVYLFAHSRKAPAGYTPSGGWFTRIDELRAGDTIIVTYHGQTFLYTVTTSFVVNPEDTYVYQHNSVYPEHRSLTLQTCYPRGETGQRLIVRAVGW